MKKIYRSSIVLLLLLTGLVSFIPKDESTSKSGDYIVIAWNDLGMHCANKNFSNLCILPPYNNQYVHVIQRGSTSSMPVVIDSTAGFHLTYEIPGNTVSTTKTNFWDYAQQLFGVTLPPNIGLTGLGLSGNMLETKNYFYAVGIPNTPYQDANLVTEDPYQLTLIQLYNSSNQLLANTQSVIPVSNEINCVSSGCHSSEMGILQAHEQVPGFNIANKPIFCATCHADPILGMQGQSGVPPFSQVMHQKHGEETNDCYKCHPGPNTQCFRDVMHTAGLTCQTCHGSVSNVGNTIENGRQPWFQEPQCGANQCHGPNYSEEPGKLFRQSKGHGNLYCSTCHNSPHVILPSENARDNMQVISLQGYAGTLKVCDVCHGYTPSGPGPHGFNPLGINPISSTVPDRNELLPVYPNPSSTMSIVPFKICKEGNVNISILDQNGREMRTLINQVLKPGEYKTELSTGSLHEGLYICRLTSNGEIYLSRLLVIR